MEPVLTPEQMAACDRAAIEAGTPERVLVERAAGAVARAARRILGGVYGRRVVFVCGKGNNGEDGRVAAAQLRRWGVGADVFDLGGPVDRGAVTAALDRADLFVDAMYGTGFRGRLEGDAAWVAHEAARVAPTLSIDIPSGVDGLTGVVDGVAVVADATVSFAAVKPGLLFEPGRSHAGEVRVADIGVDPAAAGPVCTFVLDADDVGARLPKPDPAQHKWSAGVLVVAGSQGMTGAALLVSRAALAAGAGMVVCGLPGDEAAARASGTEVVTRSLPATAGGGLAADAASTVLDACERFRALVIGPGLGRDPQTAEAVRRIVAAAAVPVLVDADALHAVGDDPAVWKERAGFGHPTAVVTPHAGEFAALAGAPPGADRLASARALAGDLGVVVLLKGPGTVVAAPDGRAFVNPTGGPQLASAGTGDTLAGVVGALLAQGLEPEEAAAVGAWVHGRAADTLGAHLVASDLAPELTRTLTRLPGQRG